MKLLAFVIAWAFWSSVVSTADDRRLQVTGTVRSAKTGEPLKSASVGLRPLGSEQKASLQSTTQADGSFGFAGLPPGQYQLSIRKQGYQLFQGNSAVTIRSEGEEVTRLAPALLPDGVISGRVLDADGEPIGQAEVRAYALVFSPSRATLSLGGRTETNDLGEYRLFDLPAGKYVVQVSPPRTETSAGQFYADTPAAYYPGAPGPSQAVAIELRWGQEITRADMRMPRGQSYAITGAVWDASVEAPCAKCVVQAVQHDGNFQAVLPQTARVARDGSFILRGLPPGDYSLVARQGSGRVAETSIVVRNQHVENVRLTVGVQHAVNGEVALENPPAGTIQPDWVPQLVPAALAEWWPRTEGTTNLERRFVIKGVAPGRYRLELSGLPPGAYLSTVRLGGEALQYSELVVAAESDLSGVQAVLAFDGATLQGKVRGTDVPVRIVLVPERKSAVPVRVTETAADGSFSIGSVAPGSYTVYAVPANASWQIFDPAVQTGLAQYGRKVEVAPKGTVTVEVAVVPEF